MVQLLPTIGVSLSVTGGADGAAVTYHWCPSVGYRRRGWCSCYLPLVSVCRLQEARMVQLLATIGARLSVTGGADGICICICI